MNFGSVSSTRYFFWVSVFLILIFTLIEPAALEGLNFFTSLLFWTVQIGLLIPLLILVHKYLQEIRLFNALNPWIKTGLAGIFASIIFIPVALGLDYILALDDWSVVKTSYDVWALISEEAEGLVAPVTITWIGINAPRILQLNFQIPTIDHIKKKEHLDTHTDPTSLVDQLPKNIGKDIIYLASELHYLRVITTEGETLLLHSLHNAMNDLKDKADGIQTHRSYWVNKKHIDKIVGKGADRNILTKQGYLVPISRRQLTTVKTHIKER